MSSNDPPKSPPPSLTSPAHPLSSPSLPLRADSPALSPRHKQKLLAFVGNMNEKQAAKVVLDKRGVVETFGRGAFEARSILYFKNCRDCAYRVDARCTKIFVENCHNCKFEFNAGITTGFVEVWHCSASVLLFTRTPHCLQADLNKGVQFLYKSKQDFNFLVWAGCYDMLIRFIDDGIELPLGLNLVAPDAESGIPLEVEQFQVSFVDSVLLNERIVRLEGGYPSTDRQADQFDELHRKSPTPSSSSTTSTSTTPTSSTTTTTSSSSSPAASLLTAALNAKPPEPLPNPNPNPNSNSNPILNPTPSAPPPASQHPILSVSSPIAIAPSAHRGSPHDNPSQLALLSLDKLVSGLSTSPSSRGSPSLGPSPSTSPKPASPASAFSPSSSSSAPVAIPQRPASSEPPSASPQKVDEIVLPPELSSILGGSTLNISALHRDTTPSSSPSKPSILGAPLSLSGFTSDL